MNPATGLTVLLIAPPGDTTLLADEAGGTMPTAYRHEGGPWFLTHAGAMAWHLTKDPRNIFVQPEHRALVLVLDGAPVAMGCDRAARWSNHPLIARLDEETALMIARLCARNRDARVVLLRGGREVEL